LTERQLVHRNIVATTLAVGFAVILGACGGGSHVDHAATGGRTVDIDMRDNDFSPASIQVKAGEVVQFVFHNKGAIAHDAYIGDEAAQMAHDEEMKMSSDMGHGGHGRDGVTVASGQTGTLSHTFDKSGTTIIGCHQLDHYTLGMRVHVTVT
jgi:uncharacterized cupredoxin-like copper-binding protein